MPDLPTLSGGPSETASTPASTTGIALAAHASANTKATTWTELIAATAYSTSWIMVMVGNVAANVATLIDIGVGASTSEQTLIANLYAHNPTTANNANVCYLFPLRVPAGTRLSARAQASTGSTTSHLTLVAMSSGISSPVGLDRVETIGANTTDSNGVSVDCGGTAHTDVIGELTATTSFAYRWMCLTAANPTDIATGAGTPFLVDVVTGAGGAEVPVIEDLYFASGTGSDGPVPGTYCFPCAIAAGARVAVRARCGIITAGDRVLDYVGYGVG